jgi:hypothetical protein
VVCTIDHRYTDVPTSDYIYNPSVHLTRSQEAGVSNIVPSDILFKFYHQQEPLVIIGHPVSPPCSSYFLGSSCRGFYWSILVLVIEVGTPNVHHQGNHAHRNSMHRDTWID